MVLLPPDEAARLAAESRAKQGLPPTVEDPTVIEDVATLLRPRLDRDAGAA